MKIRYLIIMVICWIVSLQLCMSASLMETGHSCYLGEDYSESLQNYSKILTDPSLHKLHPEAMFMMGLCYLKLGNTEMGLKALWQILNEYPESQWTDNACYQLAAYKERQGHSRFGEALMLYEMIMALHADSERLGSAMLGAACIKQKLGYFKEANDVIERAIKVAPNLLSSAENHLSMAKLLLHPENPTRNTEQAIHHLEIVVSQFTASEYLIEAYITLGILYWETGQQEKALGALDAVLKKNPSLALAQLVQEKVVDLYLERGDTEQAITALKILLAKYSMPTGTKRKIQKQIRELQRSHNPRVSAWHADTTGETQTKYHGNVQVEWKLATVHSDHAVADFSAGTIKATGSVHFQWNDQIVVSCDMAVILISEQKAELSGNVSVLSKRGAQSRQSMGSITVSLRNGKIAKRLKGTANE